jgi:hypothetical protein
MYSLLAHVLDVCDDPDCEIHQIEVGLAEGTVSNADLAFFIAGAQAMELAVRREYRAVGGDRTAIRDACLLAGRPIHRLGSERVGS